jgi:hypothetical protein
MQAPRDARCLHGSLRRSIALALVSRVAAIRDSNVLPADEISSHQSENRPPSLSEASYSSTYRRTVAQPAAVVGAVPSKAQ